MVVGVLFVFWLGCVVACFGFAGGLLANRAQRIVWEREDEDEYSVDRITASAQGTC